MAAGKILSIPLTDADLEHLSKVIGELEQKTEGEIRLMLVRSSSATGHVFRLLFGWILALLMLVIWMDRHHFVWTSTLYLMTGVIVFAGALAFVLSQFAFVIRSVVRPAELRRQVWNRAELEFHREGLANTKGRTGILLFVSVLERQSVVLADTGIAGRLPADFWQGVVGLMLSGARTRDWKGGLEKALRECGGILAEHFPAQGAYVNELPNAVIVRP